MILGDNRVEVIKNIKLCAENGDFNNKVELNDPVLTQKESKEITDEYLESRNCLSFKVKTSVAVCIANLATSVINKNTVIDGIEKIPRDLEGAIITSNHFSPFENTIIRKLTNQINKRLGIVCQTSNFAMNGIVGFLMNYANTIPISNEPRYLAKDFLSVLKEKLIFKKEVILLYPEQEMWFNYRKPRPVKNGAYFYAAKLNVPIVSCFVEIVDLPQDDAPDFKKLKYVLHILDVLYPDKNKSNRENTEYLAQKDYELKKRCYEKVYNKKLSYNFESTDIAGWQGSL